MTVPLILVAVALATVDAASLRKESPEKAVAVPVGPPSSTPPPPPAASSSTPVPLKITATAPAATPNSTPNPPPPMAQGRKSLKQRKPSSKKKSPNHALYTKFGLTRWEGEEARRGAAYTSEYWRDGEGGDGDAYPRIPMKVKKGGGGKRRSSEEGESDMYYVRLPPSHQYYSPFLHGHPEAEEEPSVRHEAASGSKQHSELPQEAASARTGDGATGEHSQVINIRPLPPSHTSAAFDHATSATSHRAQHRHHAVRRLPLSFRSNGKPGPVYHWNLPVLRGEEEGMRGWKKVYNTKSGAHQATHSIAHKSHPKNKQTEEATSSSSSQTAQSGAPTPASSGAASTASTTTEFPYIESDVFHVVKTVRGRVHPMAVPPLRPRVPGGHHRKPYHRKPLSSHPATAFPVTSYYSRKGTKGDSSSSSSSTASREQHQPTEVRKSFFHGNGKPHGFYVINGSKKYYHRLLP